MAKVYTTQPKSHRSAVDAIDSQDPADASSAIDTKGYKECRFDIELGGVDISNLQTQILFWNPRQQKWFGGGYRTFNSAGRHAIVVDCRGAVIFLKVTAFSGTSFSLSADYTLS